MSAHKVRRGPTGHHLGVVEIDGGHFGLLYYPSALFEQASSVQRDFLLSTLT